MAILVPYTRPDKVVVLGGEDKVKIASLFFDHVIPVSFGAYPNEVYPVEFKPGQNRSTYNAALAGLIQVIKKMSSNALTYGLPPTNEMEEQTDDFLKEYFPHLERVSIDPTRADPDLVHAYVRNIGGARDSITRCLKSLGVERIPLLVPDGSLLSTNPSVDDITITLSKMPLIDTSLATWEQILSFRQDQGSMAKLRRLRLFLYDNYLGKSSEYIQESILRDLENYETICRKHGFEFTTGVLSTVLNSKTFLTTGAITLAALLFGQASTACIAAGIGGALEIGKIALSIARKLHSLAEFRSQHPLAYIVNAKKVVEDTTFNRNAQ
jgi:hypothetical protein